MMQGNTRTRIVRRPPPKRDPWEIYDRLPPAIRAALQEGPQVWNVAVLAARYRKERRESGEARAIAHIVWLINLWNRLEIYRAQPWQEPGWGRRKPKPSPHLLANATLQTSGRPQPTPTTEDAS
jgi:hypothetical protein